ncbi:MAG: aldose epimerase family protein [Pseudomonadota bacterium]
MQSAPHRLETASGFVVDTLSVGATLSSLVVPTAREPVDVVLGYAAPTLYLTDRQYIGSTVGRYANRLADGVIKIAGTTYTLARAADARHCLHGGPVGFGRRLWRREAAARDSVRYELCSEAGDQGFPGTLNVAVVYRVAEPATLDITYSATTDATTVISLTNHSYLNLHGPDSSIDGHSLTLYADRYLPVDDELIPTGDTRSVAGTAFDYRTARKLGSEAALDTCFALSSNRDTLALAARLSSPQSGIDMTLRTTQDALQVYTGDYLHHPFRARAGLCLETQSFPDAPNQAVFPTTIIRPGERYQQQTRYEFAIHS